MRNPIALLVLVLASAACGGTVSGGFEPSRVYRATGSASVTSSGVVIAACRAPGDVVLSGGCAIGGGPNGNDPNAWITQNEATPGGWACAAWVSEPETVAGRDHVLSAEVTCYSEGPGRENGGNLWLYAP